MNRIIALFCATTSNLFLKLCSNMPMNNTEITLKMVFNHSAKSVIVMLKGLSIDVQTQEWLLSDMIMCAPQGVHHHVAAFLKGHEQHKYPIYIQQQYSHKTVHMGYMGGCWLLTNNIPIKPYSDGTWSMMLPLCCSWSGHSQQPAGGFLADHYTGEYLRNKKVKTQVV